MTHRVFVVGTDTAVGKTTVVAHLLRAAQHCGRRVLPFKPAASGDPDTESDPDRLLAALADPCIDVEQICPLRYPMPLAPGIASDGDAFARASPAVDWNPLQRVQRALDDLERRHRPEIVFIEGAGGFHVPMPGGSWQPQWIAALASSTLVVGRAGLGAINHACLTVTALDHLQRRPIGFVLVETEPPDPSNHLNPEVIARATSVPHLGTLPHGSTTPSRPDPLAAVWDRLPR